MQAFIEVLFSNQENLLKFFCNIVSFLTQESLISMILGVILISIAMAEVFRFMVMWVFRDSFESIESVDLHRKVVAFSVMVCPYVFITFKMSEKAWDDGRDFYFLLMAPFCFLLHFLSIKLFEGFHFLLSLKESKISFELKPKNSPSSSKKRKKTIQRRQLRKDNLEKITCKEK